MAEGSLLEKHNAQLRVRLSVCMACRAGGGCASCLFMVGPLIRKERLQFYLFDYSLCCYNLESRGIMLA